MTALFKFIIGSFSDKVNGFNCQLAFLCKGFSKSQILGFKVHVVEAIAHKIN